jgi:hypothetical protein
VGQQSLPVKLVEQHLNGPLAQALLGKNHPLSQVSAGFIGGIGMVSQLFRGLVPFAQSIVPAPEVLQVVMAPVESVGGEGYPTPRSTGFHPGQKVRCRTDGQPSHGLEPWFGGTWPLGGKAGGFQPGRWRAGVCFQLPGLLFQQLGLPFLPSPPGSHPQHAQNPRGTQKKSPTGEGPKLPCLGRV